MISCKVIALILEPNRNATSSKAAIKTSETTNPQPDHLENVDVEYEYEPFDQYEEESENGQKPQDEEKGLGELSENEQELQNQELQENGDKE